MKHTTSTGLWISIVAFTLFSAVAGAGWTHGPDLALINTAQRHATVWLDGLGRFFSVAGGWELTSLALFLVAGAMFLRGRRRLAVRLLIAFVVTALLEYLLKSILPVSPIPSGLGRDEDFVPFFEIHYPYPYPSGHMLRSTIILGALYLWSGSRAMACFLALYVVGMGYSRFYLGVHWPSDVVGGLLLGIVALAWAFRDRKGRA